MVWAMTRRRALALAGGVAITSPFGRYAFADEPRRGGTLTVGFNSDAKTFDPIFSIQYSERQVLYLAFNTLLRMGTDFSLQPELAKSWDVEQDGTRIVFHLQEGVKFHDGTDFDAEAVKWNLDQRLDEAVNSPQRSILAPVIKSVEVLGKHSVAVTTIEPYPPLLSYLAERPGFMVSPTAAKKHGADFGSHPVGTGPFVFKEWVRGSNLTLERNPDYWEAGLPYLDKIVFSDISGAIVGVQRLITGEVDFVDSLSPQDIRQIESNPKIKLDVVKVGRWYSMQWHWDEAPFNNPDLRRAIAHAIDRNRINEITMNGRATLANSPTPPGLWWHHPGIPGYDYDPAKAKDYLDKAGYADGLEVTLATPTDAVLRQINQLVQEQLGEISIKVALEPVAQSEWYSRVVKRSINFTPMRWTQRPDPDGLLSILFDSSGFANSTGYSNPEVDRMLGEARQIFDQDRRKELYAKVQEQISADLPYVPLYFAAEYAALRNDVMNFVWTPDQIPRFASVWKA